MIRNKWVSAAATLWIVGVTVRYGSTVVHSVRHPFNTGRDIEWFVIWLVAAAVVIVLGMAAKHPARIVFPLLGAGCLLVLILSGTFVSAVVVCGFLLLAHLWGRCILRLLGLTPDSIAITIPLGLIVPALAGFVLAALHVLSTATIATVLAALALIAARSGARNPRHPFRVRLLASDTLQAYAKNAYAWLISQHASGVPQYSLPVLLLAPVIFFNLLWAVAPEIQFDSNNYHLAVSQTYLRSHGFVDLPYSFHSYFYHLVEMLFTIALALHGAAAVKLLSFAFSLIAALAVYTLGKLLFDEEVGIWAAAFFYTTPVVSWLAGTAYIDNAVAMFLTATLITFFRWHFGHEHTAWLYASALLAGATMAAKMNGAFGIPIMLVIAIWILRTRPRTLATCALLAIGVALPWYVVTYLWTGNPIFPMLNGIFKSPLWDFENHVMNAADFGFGIAPRALLRLPFRLVFNTERFGEAWPRGAAGVVVLFALPLAVLLLYRDKGIRAALLAIVTVHFSLWALSFQYARYYVHMLPLICVLGAAAICAFAAQNWLGSINKICLTCALILQFTTTPVAYWNIAERFPVRLAFGRESRENFLRRALSDYAGAKRLNEITGPTDRIVGVDVEDARFYLNAPLETLADATLGSPLKSVGSLSDERLLRALKQNGFTYIFVRRSALTDSASSYPYLKPDFLAGFSTVAFSDANTVVYRLNP